ncbi:MAG: hypothetical protein MJ113_06895 [Lachnospiraceae bacterium]|nr:hypothetical protein [Lachnospiraceae bacterium]
MNEKETVDNSEKKKEELNKIEEIGKGIVEILPTTKIRRTRFMRYLDKLKDALKHKKGTGILYLTLRALVIAALVLSIWGRQYENAMICVLTLIMFLIPTFVEDTFKVSFPSVFEVIILLFIFAAEILGELASFYTRVPGWDTALHTINGFNFAAVGFAMVDFFNRNKHFSMKLSPLYLAISAFCFSMTIGVLWEFFEFGMDYFFKLDMQKDFVVTSINSVTLDPKGLNNVVHVKDIAETYVVTKDGQTINLGVAGYLDTGIIDTMKDLLVNFVGAIVFSVIGALYANRRDGRNKLMTQLTDGLIPKVLDSEDDTEEQEFKDSIFD